MSLQYKNLIKHLDIHNKITANSIIEGSKPYILSQIFTNLKMNLTYIASDATDLEQLGKNIKFFLPDSKIIIIPDWDNAPYDKLSPTQRVSAARTASLCELLNIKDKALIITNISSILQTTIPKKILKEYIINIQLNQSINREDLINKLLEIGYIRSDIANNCGELAVRGSILDIITQHDKEGYRLDFFSNQLESIRVFDPSTQISYKQINEIDIYPINEIIFSEKIIEDFLYNYKQIFPNDLHKDILYQTIREKIKYPGIEYFLPIFYRQAENIFHYINDDNLIVFEHSFKHDLNNKTDYISNCFNEKKQNVTSKITPIEDLWLNYDNIAKIIQPYKQIEFYPFNQEGEKNIDLKIRENSNLQAESKVKHQHIFQLLTNILSSTDKPVFIACSSKGSKERLVNIIKNNELDFTELDSWPNNINKLNNKVINLIVLKLEKGFENSEFIIFSEQEILGITIAKQRKSNKKLQNFLSEAASLSEGELIVHKQYGIGKFEGIVTLDISGAPHDCLKIIYDGGDKLFIPVENIDLISKYGISDNVSLDKLGNLGWQTRTAKLKERIKIAAEKLLKIAAKRELDQGHILIAQQKEYKKFCEKFPFVETDDQITAIEEIENDLSSGRPMDRLICGDVGFGKTEIALRAAFIAAMPEEARQKVQIALIVPTTLLARQHYHNFKKRFKGFPVKIKQLSRLVTKKEIKQIKEDLAKGDIDIIIGTHTLLAKTIKFNKLGLLIIDEEQHFGVTQKEKLKELKSNIHVLTLTATPIPRTLQMSLVGIKELSLLASPPVDRIAVTTFVLPFDELVIKEAIMREYYRGGKCFYVCPRISDLAETEAILRTIVPEIKIITAHGQMSSESLDGIITDFDDGKYNLLLSTTIIESGLDIASANTIIIHRADMLGLAQLYQLRGRVGRGKIKAYAYLTLPKNLAVTKTAHKRLQVMQTLDSLGAGFNLASHDMDIRGFGNLVGDEQSGHIKEVGVELYQEMLRETIANIKAEQQQITDINVTNEIWSPQINIGLAVRIPENYVPEISIRMGLYKRISTLSNEQEIEHFATEMIDRFGSLPLEVNHLLLVVKLKQLCLKTFVAKIDAGPKGIIISFIEQGFPQPDKLIQYINNNPLMFKPKPGNKLLIITEFKDEQKRATFIIEFLTKLQNCLR